MKLWWGFLPAFKVWHKPHTGYGFSRLCMNFHDTHSNIWDLPCKSQSCAGLRKFCANFIPDGYNLLAKIHMRNASIMQYTIVIT